MSFLGLCKAMDLDPVALREGIKLLDKDSMKSRMSETRQNVSESDSCIGSVPCLYHGLLIDDDELPSDTSSDYYDYVVGED
jgi:hypothetical protein